MKKIIFTFLLIFFLSFFTNSIYAEKDQDDSSATQSAQTAAAAASISWVADEGITIAGKGVARAGHFIDWVLKYPQWYYIQSTNDNPLTFFWKNIRNLSYAYLIVFLVIIAFILIINRGKSITLKQILPRLIIVLVGISFSFAILQFLYQVTDIVQGYLLRLSTSTPISSKDLLSVGFNYQDFQGFKADGAVNSESYKTTLFLTNATSITYYVMGTILLLRKAFLWMFIAASPLFAILLIIPSSYKLLKFLFGNLMRWLLYGPLFYLFIGVYITLWKIGIPLPFDFLRTDLVYPNGANILLAGPGQQASINNNLNTPDTFIYYVFALIMLWAIMAIPFVITHLFIKNFKNLLQSDNKFIKRFVNMNFMNSMGLKESFNNGRPTENATYFSSQDPNSRIKNSPL